MSVCERTRARTLMSLDESACVRVRRARGRLAGATPRAGAGTRARAICMAAVCVCVCARVRACATDAPPALAGGLARAGGRTAGGRVRSAARMAQTASTHAPDYTHTRTHTRTHTHTHTHTRALAWPATHGARARVATRAQPKALCGTHRHPSQNRSNGTHTWSTCIVYLHGFRIYAPLPRVNTLDSTWSSGTARPRGTGATNKVNPDLN